MDPKCPLFLGKNRQHMAVYAKMISYIREVLSIAKAYMSWGTLKCDMVYAVLITGVSQVSILQAGNLARDSSPARLHFSRCITTNYLKQDSMLHAVLASVSSQPVCKCQTLTYIKSCQYFGLLGHISC